MTERSNIMSTHPAPAQAAEPDFDDCAESPTGKHSASWFSNDNCEYCNTGEVSAPLYYAPSEMQLTPQEQEHVATVQCINGVTIGYLEKMLPVGTKLYTAQPARQPLTQPEKQRLWNDAMHNNRSSTTDAAMEYGRAIEIAHGIGGEKP